MRTVFGVAAVLVSGAVLGLSGCSTYGSETASADTTKLAATNDGAEVVLVAMHADWCGACTSLGPKVVAAASEMDGRGVKLVKADLTDRENPAGKATLETMGLGGLYAENKGKTGLVYILDADSGEVLGTIRGNSVTTASIVEDVSAALVRVEG
ncbi:MAG: thioredoxin domain-containing protein [Planctomycetota bacterium]